jgi:thiol-disulfide isomerase/thioredoxin
MSSVAQTDSTAPYWKNKNLPAFRLVVIKDSTFFTDSNLVKNKTTVFMLFNPECEHCQDQFKMLVTIPELKKNAQIILASTEQWEKMAAFYLKYEVAKYPFITLCKDYKFTFGSFFRPHTIPVIAVYDKQGKFVFIKQGQVKKKELLPYLKK